METTKLNSNVSKKGINLNNTKTKETFLDAKKEAIKNDLKIENLDFLKDLDNLNLKTNVDKLKVSTKGENNGNYLYKYELKNDLTHDEKTILRRKLRKQKNAICTNIILYKEKKQIENLKISVSKFLEFYKKEFILNDFSITSFCAKNTDEKNLNLYNDALSIVKILKDKI
jgi:hypothetical protein